MRRAIVAVIGFTVWLSDWRRGSSVVSDPSDFAWLAIRQLNSFGHGDGCWREPRARFAKKERKPTLSIPMEGREFSRAKADRFKRHSQMCCRRANNSNQE